MVQPVARACKTCVDDAPANVGGTGQAGTNETGNDGA
jgi:hypothetical protein